jgi:hypothetical protein
LLRCVYSYCAPVAIASAEMIWNEPGGLHAVLCERALASCYVEDLGGHILHKRLSSSVGRLINEKFPVDRVM